MRARRRLIRQPDIPYVGASQGPCSAARVDAELRNQPNGTRHAAVSSSKKTACGPVELEPLAARRRSLAMRVAIVLLLDPNPHLEPYPSPTHKIPRNANGEPKVGSSCACATTQAPRGNRALGFGPTCGRRASHARGRGTHSLGSGLPCRGVCVPTFPFFPAPSLAFRVFVTALRRGNVGVHGSLRRGGNFRPEAARCAGQADAVTRRPMAVMAHNKKDLQRLSGGSGSAGRRPCARSVHFRFLQLG